jgi:hypothetical protein
VIWLPIASAPKERGGVLLYCPNERHDETLPGQDYSIQIGFWDGAFLQQGTGHRYDEEAAEGWSDMPTRWMPLPAPPTEEE